MRYSKIIALLLFGFALLASPSLLSAQETNRDAYELKVDGLGCPFCAYGLEKKFKEFKSLKDLQLDMETGIFQFTYPSDEPLTLDQVEKQVDVAGYSPVSTKITRADGTVEVNKSEPVGGFNPDNLIEGSFYVAGNCDMCRARIEGKAYKTMGVANASWDEDSKMFTVSYDPEVVELTVIEQRISERGYDTVNYTADEETYKNLPACCHYKRNMISKLLKKNGQ